MRKPFCIFQVFFLLFQVFHAYSQVEICVKIKNAETGQPVSYATVAVKNTNNGTYANHEGKFFLSEFELNDTLVLSSIGFYPKHIPISNLMGSEPSIVSMTPKVYELKELIIKPTIPSEVSKLGFYKPSMNPGIQQVIFPDKLTFAQATYQGNPDKIKGFIREISIRLSSYDSEGDSLAFRVNLYTFDHQQRTPGKLLIDRDFIVYWKKGGKKILHVPLRNFDLPLPENGFYVVVQCLGSYDKQGKRIFGSIGFKFAKTKTVKPFSCSKNRINEWSFDMVYNRKEGSYNNFNVWSTIEIM